MTSIDGLLEQPDRVSEVPAGEVSGLLVRLGALLTALAARHAASASNGNKVLQLEATDNSDRILTADEAAESCNTRDHVALGDCQESVETQGVLQVLRALNHQLGGVDGAPSISEAEAS